MKYSTKKIILFSIALISALMLLIGLAFTVITYEIPGLSGSASSAVDNVLGVTGFDMLKFNFLR